MFILRLISFNHTRSPTMITRSFFFSFTLEIEMSIHDRITLAKGSGTFLFYSSKKKNTELAWNKEKCNNINNLLLAKPDIHVYVYKSICPYIIFYVSCIFDLKRRNYSMTCFMFIDNRLRNTDIKLVDIWTIIIVIVEFICRLNKLKLYMSCHRKKNWTTYSSILFLHGCQQIIFIDL